MNFEAMYDEEGLLYGWTTIDGKNYGIECFIWAGLGAMCRFRSPVVVFTKEYGADCLEKSLVFDLTNMDVLSNTESFGKEFIRMYEWVRMNQAVLINHWNEINGYASSTQLICALCPLEKRDV